MRVILSGGGTGGHIYPALTIMRAITALQPDSQFLFIGTKQGLEADIVPKEGVSFATIEVQGLQRKLAWQNVITLGKTIGSVWQARQHIAAFRPDVVIGTGGYVCGPVLLAASLMGLPTMIQEQNVIPGVTNRILARFVQKIAVGYGEAAAHFPDKRKVIVTGNPIREAVMSAVREEAWSQLRLKPHCKTVLIAGGSRGARSINQAMLAVHRHFAGRDDIQLLHITGQNEYNGIVNSLQKDGIDLPNVGNISVQPYLYDMPQALAVADLAIFRAGAVGLAELTAKGIPAILVPYPYAAENHQEHNARALERQGAALVIRDKELTGDTLIAAMEALLASPERLTQMAAASRKLGRPDAAKVLGELACTLAGKAP